MTLNELRPLVEMIAAERTTSTPHLFDDAVQEGLIAAWQAHTARPDAPRQYLVGAARNGVRSVLRGRPMTGQAGHRGRKYNDALDWAAELMTADADDDTTGAHAPHLADPAEADRLASVPLRVAWDAVRRLPSTDAQIATLRAYGYEWREVADRVGLKSEATRRRFVQHIAPRLAAELHHLRGAA